MREEWKLIPGYDGYEASSMGRVRSYKKLGNGRVLRSYVNQGGYVRISLYKNSTKKEFSAHRLVLMAFVGVKPKEFHCDHIDRVRTNNKLSNLRYLTAKENNRRAYGVKLSMKIAQKIRSQAKTKSQSNLAKTYGVASKTISAIINNKTWV